uniref:Uncharacterized protein n=1 Tax=Brassica oleracea TaxID=3712 RepID=A0A3P6DDU5_BRAOL|nr:unnamed protein product [Brassica oleracea]
MENTRLILSQVISGLQTSTIFSSATMLTEIIGLLYASSCIRGKFTCSLILGTRRSPKMRTREIAVCTL